MKTLPLVVTLILLVGCAHSDPWTKQDTVLQLITTGAFALDAIQTSDIQYHRGHREVGLLARHALGPQPHTAETWQYFATVALSHYLVSRILPAKWRPWWQGATIALETRAIIHNCTVGVSSPCHRRTKDRTGRVQKP